MPPADQHPVGFTNVPSNVSRDRARGPHYSFQVDGTVTFAAAGRHQMKGGVQFDRVGIDTLTGATGNVINLFWGQRFAGVQGRYGYYTVGSNDVVPNRGVIIAGRATVNNVGLFLQDEWALGPRLTLHAGLRTENEHVPSLSNDPSIPRTAIHFGFGDKLAPRLGLAWDATGDRKTKVYGSWGVFYDITSCRSRRASAGSGRTGSGTRWTARTSRRLWQPGLPAGVPRHAHPRLRVARRPDRLFGGRRNRPRARPDAAAGDLIGAEREIAPAVALSARYVHKQLDRALEDVATQDAGESEPLIRIANPGFGAASEFYPGGGLTPLALPGAVRDYDALEIALERRLAGRWAGRVAYTWSRLSGNYSGLAQSDEDGRVQPNISLSFDYPMRSFDEQGRPVYGVLATDCPHQLKAQGVYIWPFGTSAGFSWYGGSGIPRTREAVYAPDIPIMYRGRKSDGRLPFLSRLDFHARHDMRLGARYTLGISANVLNVFNQGTATNYFARELFQGQFIIVDEQEFFFQGVNTEGLIAEQQLARDARFLLDSGYQAPRSVRLGLSFSF